MDKSTNEKREVSEQELADPFEPWMDDKYRYKHVEGEHGSASCRSQVDVREA